MTKKIKCPHCGYVWEYKGKAGEDDYVSCPKCRFQRLRKNYEVIK